MFLLLKGKNYPRAHAIKKLIFKRKEAIYMDYPKFHKVEEWNHIHMRIDDWDFTIIKEMKGP